MPTDRHFVGREAELSRFRELLEDPAGRAVLIVGPEKMGKSFLARRMLEEAEGHPTLTCGTVSYQVAATDPPEQVMERMIEDAFAGGGAEGSLSASPHRRRRPPLRPAAQQAPHRPLRGRPVRGGRQGRGSRGPRRLVPRPGAGKPLAHPRAFESWMRTMVGVYAERCEESGAEPDGELVGPIQEALARLEEDGDSGV